MRMQATLLLAAALQTAALVAPPPRRPQSCALKSSPSDRFGSLPKAQQYEALLLAALSGQQRDIDIALQLIEEMAAKNVGKVPEMAFRGVRICWSELIALSCVGSVPESPFEVSCSSATSVPRQMMPYHPWHGSVSPNQPELLNQRAPFVESYRAPKARCTSLAWPARAAAPSPNVSQRYTKTTTSLMVVAREGACSATLYSPSPLAQHPVSAGRRADDPCCVCLRSGAA